MSQVPPPPFDSSGTGQPAVDWPTTDDNPDPLASPPHADYASASPVGQAYQPTVRPRPNLLPLSTASSVRPPSFEPAARPTAQEVPPPRFEPTHLTEQTVRPAQQPPSFAPAPPAPNEQPGRLDQPPSFQPSSSLPPQRPDRPVGAAQQPEPVPGPASAASQMPAANLAAAPRRSVGAAPRLFPSAVVHAGKPLGESDTQTALPPFTLAPPQAVSGQVDQPNYDPAVVRASTPPVAASPVPTPTAHYHPPAMPASPPPAPVPAPAPPAFDGLADNTTSGWPWDGESAAPLFGAAATEPANADTAQPTGLEPVAPAVEQPAVAWRVELPAAEPVAAAVPATLDEPATPAEAAAPQTEYWPDDTAEPTGFTETISNPADISPTDLTTTPEVSGVAAATPSQVLATSVNLATSNPWIVWLWVVGLVLTLSGFALTGLLSGQLITTIAAALTALGTAALAAGLVLSGLRWWLRRWPVGH